MRPRALLTGERVDWVTEKPDRRRFGGAVLFGTGWAVTGACPGPIAAQLGQGVLWSVFTLAGVVIGIVAFLAVQRRGRGERGLRRRLAVDRYALAVDGKQL
ncbi:MAG: YeeE/YedE family protein [Actinomycetota bacterium]|nr:YeeE/YedE family protein [Actinomycetota bacterium]